MNKNESNTRHNKVMFPPYISLAHMFNAPQGWQIKERTLSYFQIQYVVKGMVLYEIEGKEYITKRGDLLIHKPFQKHSVTMMAHEPYICISILFHFGSSNFLYDHLFDENHHKGTFVNDEIEHQLSRLVFSYQQPQLAQQILSQGLLMQILAELSISTTNNPQTNKQIQNKAKMVLLRNYLTENYNKDIKLEDLEKITCFHRNSILLQFKRSFGQSPHQYLTRIRIEKAKELALQTNYSISEIARFVGYSDVHSFGKIFKKKTGLSLSQFCSSLTLE